jgi:hypothetical protein
MKSSMLASTGLALLATAVVAAERKPLTETEMKALLRNGLTIGIIDVNGGAQSDCANWQLAFKGCEILSRAQAS